MTKKEITLLNYARKRRIANRRLGTVYIMRLSIVTVGVLLHALSSGCRLRGAFSHGVFAHGLQGGLVSSNDTMWAFPQSAHLRYGPQV